METMAAYPFQVGEKVYIDSCGGLVPAVVETVGEQVTIRVTASRRGYYRGERITYRPTTLAVVPRHAVRVRGGQYRIWAY